MQRATGVPIDSFTLDDGWDFDWDREHGIWGRLHRQRFPGGWDALSRVGQGFLALRNPASDPRSLESPLADILELSAEDLEDALRFAPVFGRTDQLGSIEDPRARQEIRLPSFGIAVWEVRTADGN